MSDYYKFGKVEVLDISRHLTSNAGQALQYIARSSRLDGNNKGDTVGDLCKAIDFLRDELKRVEVENRTEAGLLRIFRNANIGDNHTVDGDEYWQKIAEDTWRIIAGELPSRYLISGEDLARRLAND